MIIAHFENIALPHSKDSCLKDQKTVQEIALQRGIMEHELAQNNEELSSLIEKANNP